MSFKLSNKVISIFTLITFLSTNSIYAGIVISPYFNKVSTNLRAPLTFSKDSVNPTKARIAGLMGSNDAGSQASIDAVNEAIDSILSEGDGQVIADAFGKLQDSVANSEALIVIIAEKMLGLSEQQESIVKSNFLKWRPGKEDYSTTLIRSVVNNPEAWKPFFASIEEDASRGMRIFSGNRDVFERARNGEHGFATTVIKGSDLSEALPGQIIDITKLKPEELQKLIESGEPRHVLAPIQGKMVHCCALLGGAGSRYQESLIRNPEIFKQIHRMLPPGLQTYAAQFKASLPVGDKITILNVQLGRDKNIAGQGFVTMASYNNAVEARLFLEKELKAKGVSQPNIELFVQPITPRRIPTEEAFKAFAAKEKIVEKGKITQQEFDDTIIFCRAHEGEIALDSGNRPIFGPENHWDFIKNLVQSGSLLELIEQRMVDGHIKDEILRVHNQDDLGSALGRDRPSQAAISALVGNMQKENGLYDFLKEMDSIEDTEWRRYRDSEEYREKLVEKIGAIVEGGLTPEYNTTGGFIGRFREKGLVVVERANIQGQTPQINITNSNTINESLLAIAAMCGLRPKDLKRIIKEKQSNGGRITDAQKVELEKRVLSVEEIVPVRQQVKIMRTKDKKVLPVQGAERDMHGMLGRSGGFGMMLLIGESMETYKKQMKGHDKFLLAGQIDFSEHQKREAGLALNLTFVPHKDLEQWQASSRIRRSLLKNLGYKQDPPVRPPEEVLAGLQNPTAESLLKALQNEGYCLDESDLSLAKAFLENKTAELTVAEETPAIRPIGSVLRLLYALADSGKNPGDIVTADDIQQLDTNKRILKSGATKGKFGVQTVRNELEDAAELGIVKWHHAEKKGLSDKFEVLVKFTKEQLDGLPSDIKRKLNRGRINAEEIGEIRSAIQEAINLRLASNENVITGFSFYDLPATIIIKNKKLRMIPLTPKLMLAKPDDFFTLQNSIAADVEWTKERDVINVAKGMKNGPIFFDPDLKCSFVIMDENDMPVAVAMFSSADKRDGYVYLETFAVLPEYQNTGVASWLLLYSFQEAKKQGFGNVSWITREELDDGELADPYKMHAERAIPYYERKVQAIRDEAKGENGRISPKEVSGGDKKVNWKIRSGKWHVAFCKDLRDLSSLFIDFQTSLSRGATTADFGEHAGVVSVLNQIAVPSRQAL